MTTDRPDPPPEPDDTTRAELYEMAQAADVEGRSGLTKDELHRALVERSGDPDGDSATDRVDQFCVLAEAVARGEFVMLPRRLEGEDRRLHVRQTLREDHRTRITQRADGAREKFDELADSLFSFFRGTALLFYRDMAGEDALMPTVLTLGDVHPANFGVMPNEDNVPIFGVNDFDEAYYAPFTWDLKRGAVGFMIAAEALGDHSRKKQLKVARRFVRGYIAGIERFAEDNTETDHEVRIDNASKLIRTMMEDAQTDRGEWLVDEYHDEHRRGFRSDDELVPQSSRRDEFQRLVHRLVERLDLDPPARAGELRVKDVALRRGQGTASLGLPRYYVMVEGPLADGTDDLIIEFKQARRSALAGLVPPVDLGFETPGDRIAHAQGVQLVRGDVFYGDVELDGQSFMSRERAPYRDDVDLDDLSTSGWKDYADTCGRALAHAHALSDEIGSIERDIEPDILASMGPRDLFVDDMLRFAEEATERVHRDHELFRRDHALGAFSRIDVAFQ